MILACDLDMEIEFVTNDIFQRVVNNSGKTVLACLIEKLVDSSYNEENNITI